MAHRHRSLHDHVDLGLGLQLWNPDRYADAFGVSPEEFRNLLVANGCPILRLPPGPSAKEWVWHTSVQCLIADLLTWTEQDREEIPRDERIRMVVAMMVYGSRLAHYLPDEKQTRRIRRSFRAFRIKADAERRAKAMGLLKADAVYPPERNINLNADPDFQPPETQA